MWNRSRIDGVSAPATSRVRASARRSWRRSPVSVAISRTEGSIRRCTSDLPSRSALSPLGAVLLTAALVAGCSGSGRGVLAAAGVTPGGPAGRAERPASRRRRSSREPSPASAPTPVPRTGRPPARRGPMRHGIEQVWVPAGTFTMGTDAAADRRPREAGPPDWVATEFPSEQPAARGDPDQGLLDRRRPRSRTRAFDAFVDAGGYTNQALWSDDGWAWLDDEGCRRACRCTATATSPSSRGCA